jgi:hypothetical protein
MAKKKGIPISEAKRLAKAHGLPMVIIFSLDDSGEAFAVSSYGSNKALCDKAAGLADQIVAKVLRGEIEPPLADAPPAQPPFPEGKP